MTDMDQVDHSMVEGAPLLLFVNTLFYLFSNVLTTLLVLNPDFMQLIQLTFTCTGILISNMVLLIVNWKTIKKWFKSDSKS